MNSDLFKLNWKDIVNSLVLGVLTSVISAILPVLESGAFPTADNLLAALGIGVTTALANVLRKLLTTSDNTFLIPEKK